MTQRKKEQFNFEAGLENLTHLVEQLEKGGQSLEEALQSYEQGIKLIQQCQQALKQAEQRVQILADQHPQADLIPYQTETDE